MFLFSNKLLYKRLCDQYAVLNGGCQPYIFDKDVLKMLNYYRMLKPLAFEQNHIELLERVVMSDRMTDRRNWCTQCAAQLISNPVYTYSFELLKPQFADNFVWSRDEIDKMFGYDFLWCTTCEEPLFDWHELPQAYITTVEIDIAIN